MLIPIIRECTSSKSPLEVYQHIYREKEDSFFLDSPQYHPPDQAYSYLGLRPFLQIKLIEEKVILSGKKEGVFSASEFFQKMRELSKEYKCAEEFRKNFFLGGAVGFFGYEAVQFFEKVSFHKEKSSTFPFAYFGFYKDLIVFDHQREIYYLVTHIESESSEQDKLKADDRLNDLARFLEEIPHVLEDPFCLHRFQPEMKQGEFMAMVKQAKEYIAAGDIYQANLSQKFQFDFSGSALDLYERLRKINPSPFASFFKIGDMQIVSNSPERLVRKKKDLCETRPIAGTRPVKNQPRSLDEIQKEFLENEKECAEHIMLVDLERNDLGRVCNYESVKVEEMMGVERYSHVMHIVSKIVGTLSEGKDAFDLMQAMFPGGTITGCPKVRCMEIIEELEPSRRNLYTGSIGYFDFFGDMDLNIVIRTLVLEGDQGTLQVGAGIVHDSDPRKEYEETLHKGEALTEALVSM